LELTTIADSANGRRPLVTAEAAIDGVAQGPTSAALVTVTE
jgi:hypothetical protein